MCFNTVIINKSGKDILPILEKTKPFMERNNDGFSLWAYLSDSGNKEILVRTPDKDRIISAFNDIRYANVVHIHYRLASSGSRDPENIHMWKVANFYVSHNGFVGKYNIGSIGISKVESDSDTTIRLSDTYKFVHSIDFISSLTEMNLKSLAELAEESAFYGVLFATNPRYTLVLSRGKSVKVTTENDVLIFSNDWYIHGSMSLFGIDFNIEREFENVVLLYDNESLRIIDSASVQYAIPYYRYDYNDAYVVGYLGSTDYYDYTVRDCGDTCGLNDDLNEHDNTFRINIRSRDRNKRKKDNRKRKNKRGKDYWKEYWKWLWDIDDDYFD